MSETSSPDKLMLKRKKGLLSVFLTGNQVDLSVKDFLSTYVTFSNNSLQLDGDSASYSARLDYTLPLRAVPWSVKLEQAKSKLDKLKLVNQMLENLPSALGVRVPYLYPDNLFFVDDQVKLIHQGVEGLLAPQGLSSDDELKSHQALILSVLNPQAPFEKWQGNSKIVNDALSAQILSTKSVADLKTLIIDAYQTEYAEVGQKLRPVNKTKYLSLKIWGIIGLVLVLGLSVASFLSYGYWMPQKDKIVSAQAAFLTNNYAGTLDNLKSYPPSNLPKSAQYIAAASSVNLSDLTETQKTTILQKLSDKTDENTLSYWIYSGRGNFEKSLNLAQNLGDNQLTLLAYSNLYDATKLDEAMDGAKKQKLLEDYTKQITDLKKKLGLE